MAANASSAMIKGKAETEAALAKATAQAEDAFSKTKDEGRVMVANVQSGLDAAQVSRNHARFESFFDSTLTA